MALLAVLWVLAAGGTAVTLGLAAVRDGIATSTYRSEFTRGRWEAEGCLTEFRAQFERALRRSVSALSVTNRDLWIDPRSAVPRDCDIRLAHPSDGPIDLNAATDSSLLMLPGFDPEVVVAVRSRLVDGRRIESLDQLLGDLPAELRERVTPHYAELVGRLVYRPPAWVVTAMARVAGRATRISTERWVQAGSRVAVVRREVQ